MTYFTRTWKPVKINGQIQSTGVGSVSNSGSMAWFNKLVELGIEREQKLEKFRIMDRSVDIFRALDIIAEDISSENADDGEVFVLEFPEDQKINKSTFNTINKAKRNWEKKIQFDYRFFDYCRKMLKYGCVMFKENNDGTLQELYQDRIKGYIMDEKDETKVKYYLYDPNGYVKDENGNIVIEGKTDTGNKREYDKIKPKDLLILKVGDEPLGESILEKIYNVWRRLQLLEDAVIIYRIVRAPERRVFYIDIGRMPAHKSEAYIEKVKNRIRQKQVLNNNNLETDYNPASMQEDYFIGVASDSRGSRVETLPGGDNLGRIEDLQYFNKKLALALRIPPSYLDSYSDDINGASYNDGRLGTAYIAELRYAGFVKRLQKRIVKEIFQNFRKYCKKNDIELPEGMEMSIAPPQSFAIYKENELYNALLNTYGSAESIESLSRRESLRRFLDLDEDEIVANEFSKLKEMGFSDKDIRSFPEEVKFNLIYGDGETARIWIENNKTEVELPTEQPENQQQEFNQ